MRKRDINSRSRLRTACIPLAILFVWMCTVGALTHTHIYVHGGAGAASIHTPTAVCDPDEDCGACDWNLAIQAAIGVAYRLHISSTSISLPLERIVLRHLSRRPLSVSLRAPPARDIA